MRSKNQEIMNEIVSYILLFIILIHWFLKIKCFIITLVQSL